MADSPDIENDLTPAARDEAARLAELRDLTILDTPHEAEFDDLVETASLIAGTPIALMTLIDDDRQWFKARKGLEIDETPRDVAFCNTAIQTPDQPLIVHDAHQDPRFADNPFVTGDPHIAFYAGVPIVTSGGQALGTICVIDNKPGELTQDQLDALAGLSRQAAALLELRRRTRNLSAVLDQERSGRADAPDRDPLTGLPTREVLESRIADEDPNLSTSLLMIELIHFSEVNAAIGREGGDRILQAVARQLASRLPANSMLARTESTTFAALLPDTDAERAAVMARDFTRELAAPVHANGFDPIAINSVVGSATSSPGGEARLDSLVQDAEMAVASAKRQGPGSTVAAGAQTITDRARTARLRTSLARALSDGGITAVYMPVVELASGVTVGAESLVRFPGPEFKNASIDELIALAEDNGLVGEIDAFMIDTALKEFAEGRVDAPSVGVNLSPVAIGPDLPNRIRDALERHGVNPDCLVVEITERAALSDNEDLAQALNGLAAMGVRIAIDDFGAGATSIGDLRKLPFDLLKLDRGLIADIDGADSRRAFMIVQALTGMAKGLGIDVVAEGIESERLRDRLVDAGVGFGQGYLFGRPAPAGQQPIIRDRSELGAPRPVGIHMERLAGAFFEQSPDMACVGTDEQLLRVNDNWERTLGWTREQMLSQPLREFIHPDDIALATEKFEEIAEGEPATFEVRFATPDGDWKILDWNARRDPDTGLSLATARDVTREREAEMERDRLRLVMEVLSELQEEYIEQGVSRKWWHDALDSIIELTASEYGFIGRVEYDEKAQPYLISYALTNIAWNDWSRGVFEEFKDGGLEFHNLQTLFGVTLATGEMVIANDAPHDPRRGGLPDGHPALNHYAGIPFTSDDGIVGMAGLANRPGGYTEELIEELRPIFASLSQIISRDIANRRARQVEFDASSTAAAVEAILDSHDIQHAMEIAERALKAVVPGAHAELFVIGDSRERLRRLGVQEPQGDDILHREACLALTRGEPHVTRPTDPPDQRCAHASPGSVTICVPVENPGEEFGVVIAESVLEPENGELSGEQVARLEQTLETLAAAVAEVARREDLTHRALTDSLTGLANRPAFVQSVNRALDTVASEGACFGVIMLDLDRFKEVNDTLGHQAGDMLLEEAGQRITGVLRDEDTVARLGGDEFGVIVSGCGENQELLAKACERVREVIAEMPVGEGLHVTASVGAVEMAGPDTSWDEIYRIADRELYASKKAGGDRVSVAPNRLGA